MPVCRRCPALIIFAQQNPTTANPSPGNNPLNRDPHPTKGNLRLDRATMKYDVLSREEAEAAGAAGEPLYLSHFADCPYRKQFKKKKGCLTMPSPKSYAELQAALLEPTPKHLIKTKEQGGAKIPFLNITDAHDLLDERVGPGNWAVRILDGRQVSMQYVITVRALIFAQDGTFEQDSTGFEEIDLDKFGDTSSNAYAMAVKRAFELHGLCRDLWRGEAKPARERGDQERALIRPSNPVAASVSDLATPKQLGMAKSLLEPKGRELEEFCYEALGCKSDEISKKAASYLIDLAKTAETAQNRPRTEKAGQGASPSGNASPAPASAQPAPIQGHAGTGETVENQPAAPAMKSQTEAIKNMLTRWRAIRDVPEEEVDRLLSAVGCEDRRKLTEFQAGQFIRKLQDAIKSEIESAKRAK